MNRLADWFRSYFRSTPEPKQHPIPNFRKTPEKDRAARAKEQITKAAKRAAQKEASK